MVVRTAHPTELFSTVRRPELRITEFYGDVIIVFEYRWWKQRPTIFNLVCMYVCQKKVPQIYLTRTALG